MINNHSGLSIVATILALLIFSLFIAVAVSLVTTGAHIGVQEEQGDQAFYIADGGIQYVLAYAQDTSTIPNYSTHGQWIPLGAGTFKVDTPAYLTDNIAAGATIIPVNSITSFPLTGPTGRLTIGTDFGITYTGTSTLPANCAPFNAPCFTGASGGQGHNDDNSVYPATMITITISAANCDPLPFINVAEDTGGFDIRYPFFIDSEAFLCATKTQNQFQTCQRCYMGSSKAAHPAGGGNSYASQYILTSTGMITNVLSNNVQRVVQISAGP